jgi:hypothetical protein
LGDDMTVTPDGDVLVVAVPEDHSLRTMFDEVGPEGLELTFGR